MPEAATKYFGTIEYQPEAVIRFSSGLPAFEEETEFLTLEPASSAPLVFLQSLRRPGLCFLTLPMEIVAPEYSLEMTKEDIASLGLDAARQPRPGADVRCLAMLAVPKAGGITANLLAPVVIDRAGNRVFRRSAWMPATRTSIRLGRAYARNPAEGGRIVPDRRWH
jgi:flagellar assembly factor FliW